MVRVASLAVFGFSLDDDRCIGYVTIMPSTMTTYLEDDEVEAVKRFAKTNKWSDSQTIAEFMRMAPGFRIVLAKVRDENGQKAADPPEASLDPSEAGSSG